MRLAVAAMRRRMVARSIAEEQGVFVMAGKQCLWLVIIALLPLSTAVAGCNGVVQLSPDTYMANCDSKAGVFASMSKLKATTIALANDYANKQGKIAIAISIKETRSIPFTFRWSAIEYQFRLVDPNDSAAKSTALGAGKNGLSESVDPVAATPSPPTQEAQENDIYTQLIRLEELRTKGIITQEEFEEQKKKILAGK